MTYEEWFLRSWAESGGLIQPQTAGAIIGLSGARITQIWREKKWKLYKFDDRARPLIGWKDFLVLKTERENK